MKRSFDEAAGLLRSLSQRSETQNAPEHYRFAPRIAACRELHLIPRRIITTTA